MSRGKLVRDKIPEIIRAKGEVPSTRVADSAEYRELLLAKLSEEVQEFLASDGDPEELADVLEVVMALADGLGIGQKELETSGRSAPSMRATGSSSSTRIGPGPAPCRRCWADEEQDQGGERCHGRWKRSSRRLTTSRGGSRRTAPAPAGASAVPRCARCGRLSRRSSPFLSLAKEDNEIEADFLKKIGDTEFSEPTELLDRPENLAEEAVYASIPPKAFTLRDARMRSGTGVWENVPSMRINLSSVQAWWTFDLGVPEEAREALAKMQQDAEG